jgi:hypothetical protein
MEIPPSMKDELQRWNNGEGIALDEWVGCEGRFALAVGYLSVFWPEFELMRGYIVRKGTRDEKVQGFDRDARDTRRTREATMNHIHLDSLQYLGCPDVSADKLVVLGHALKDIYEAKLQRDFPDRPCRVEFFMPTDVDQLDAYQLTFWQIAHEMDSQP